MTEVYAQNFIGGMREIWNYLSSGYAILAYAVIIIVLVALLIVSVLISDNKSKIVIDKAETSRDDESVALRDDGERKVEKKEKASGKRFPTLSRIDAERSRYERGDYDDGITLKTLCENLRNYAANQSLYYDIEDMRRFIAGLSVSHTMILDRKSVV